VLATQGGGLDPEQRKEIMTKAKKDLLSKASNRSMSVSSVIGSNGATLHKQIKRRRRQTDGTER
jgi:hypothetical protein